MFDPYRRKDLKCVICRPSFVRHLYLLSSHVSTLVHHISTFYCTYIRSSIMSHITFIMCQFVLIVHLRDYHYDFDLDIVVLWSCYGVL